MHAAARLLCAALALASLVPLAACRHGGEGLIAGRQPARPPQPAALDRPAPPRPTRLETGLSTGYRLLPPPSPHRHSGAPASTHTFHLFAPRHP